MNQESIKQPEPDLSVVIASYNTRGLLRRCIETVFETTHDASLEVIVVDDCSSDGSPEMVEHEFPHVRLIRNAENYRYAKTNNAGLVAARGRYGLLLNSDTEVQDGAFDTLVRYMDENPQVAAAGPKLINPDGSLQHCIRGFPGLTAMVFQTLNLQLIWPNNPLTRSYYYTHLTYEKPISAQSIGTTSFIIRRETWEKFGMLDERFPHWCVDQAYCFHLTQVNDCEIHLVPDAVVLHHGSQSINKLGPREIVTFHKALRQFYDLYLCRKDSGLKRAVVRAAIPVRMRLKLLEHRISRDKRLLKGPGSPNLSRQKA